MTHPTMTREVASPMRPGDWVADPAACTLAFAVRNFGLRTVTGQIPLTSAVVHVGPSGEPVSIRTGNPRRDNDLRGRRFLATDRWPVITFEAGYVKPVRTARTVSGTLTVKDTHCPVRLDVASFTIPADDMAAQVHLHATSRVDRRSAGVTAGPAFLIGHLISLSLAVRLRRQAGPPQR
jgi:polyisoprenoid-binding protein YceI